MSITHIFNLLGGVALFLFGMNLMGDGLKKVAGSKLEIILYKLTSSPIKGILLGTGVTAVIQSSSATSVMVVGFVNSGMMKVRQAIGIIMGAIIGTSITGWIICLSSVNGSGVFAILSTDTLTCLMAVAGIILLMFSKKDVHHHLSYILLGFSVLMFGISAMTDAVYPLRESEAFINLLITFNNPLIGILIGMLFTCIIQSASAAVGILQTLAVTGVISFQLALPVIMGIAIGASLPVLLSALGANANGKRTALIYLLVDFLGAIIFGILFYSINAVVHFSFMDNSMSMISIALLNTVFRVIIVILLSPFIKMIESLSELIIKEKDESAIKLKDVERLEDRFLDYPSLAVEQAGIVISSMASLAIESVKEAVVLFNNYSEEGFSKVCSLEDIVDTYEDKLGVYIVKIMKRELDESQNKTVSLYLNAINNLERMSDHAKNIAEASKEINDKKIEFSSGAVNEMLTLFAVIDEILNRTDSAFVMKNTEDACRIAPLEAIIDNCCETYKRSHINRVANGECFYSHGFVFNDILTDCERIGDHCSNIGIAIRIWYGEMSNKHGEITKQEIEKTHDFDKLYEEYSEKFAKRQVI